MRKNKGFSLVELIIVIAIIAILAGLITPATIHFIDKGRMAKQQSNVKNIYTVAETEIIEYFTLHSEFFEASATYYGAEGGKDTFVDSTTGQICGKLSSESLGAIRAGTYNSTDSREIELANDIYDAIGAKLLYDNIDPSNQDVETLSKSKVNIMIVYDEDGIIRIEYSNKGFYTIFDGKNIETVKVSDADSTVSFSEVE